MADEKMRLFKNRNEWRSWLKKNYDKETCLRVIFLKKQKDSLSYDEAVREALCFGWIDSLVQKIDEERYSYKFTPRNPGSKWSELNIKRFDELVAQGLMTPAGAAKRENAKTGISPIKTLGEMSPELLNILRQNKEAYEFFSSLPPSEKKKYSAWIQTAAKEETRQRRISEAITLLESKQKLGMK